ncbi:MULTISPECIES: phosphomannomutase [unclassified Psychrobacter]|uniref:phosphomannomutase n=1 Tax=unclassified Psychrobacter TaxID=196806 RepID=UPI0025B4F957|nr:MULTISPECIES: phosphomannomutase [unclassified Psychrobacter]MDN3452067.1 phosphomannomutase [Psychrobacter sp. APC 3350]MDN3501367.1 phosphomannomutase [Psychrobacter sp. 5A.1]
MPTFAAQQSLFRAYDIRGSRQHFTTNFIQALGNAFANLYSGLLCILEDNDSKNSLLAQQVSFIKIVIVIGYDVRNGSKAIAQKLADILAQHGLTVIQLGLVTTPMMVFWAEQYQGHGIIVTASHSAKEILGVKWLVNHQSPSSAEIQLLFHQLTKSNSKNNSVIQANTLKQNTQDTGLSTEDIATAYIKAIAQVFQQIYQSSKPHSKRPHSKVTQQPLSKLDFRVVIDCMHGATSNIAQRLFSHFCQQVIMLNDSADGSFPSGNPDPTEPHRLTQLQQSVLHHKADIGIAFDGDGDRLMIVDDSGKVVMPDHLLYLLAQVAIAERPATLHPTEPLESRVPSQVLFDIKCSHHLPTLLSELGATPVISKTGSSFMRQQIQQSDSQIVFAGELSGHFIFNDSRFIPYDDAMYAALRLLHWFSRTRNDLHDKKTLSDIIQSLPAMVSTADHYLPMPKLPMPQRPVSTLPTLSMPKTLEQDCSIVEHLATLCQYLRQLVDATVAADTGHYLATTCQPSLCHFSYDGQDITLKQAKYLLPVGTKLSCIDGVRLDFAHGFGVLRQSNTSHNLTVRFAGDSMEDLKDIQGKFAALCRPFDKTLAEQIAAIPAES